MVHIFTKISKLAILPLQFDDVHGNLFAAMGALVRVVPTSTIRQHREGF
jgi:hypothetical protein